MQIAHQHQDEAARARAAARGDAGSDIDALFERHRLRHLWMYFANIGLGLWLLASAALFDYQDTWLRWSDILSGALIVILGIVALNRGGDTWGRWGICFVGLWLWLAPLIFHVPTAYVYANDTIVGALVISFTVLAPGVPGKAHFAVMQQPGPETPPGWTYNPSSWQQRSPIILFAFLSFLISRYMAAYQFGHITSVWDPFFDTGTTRVLTSDVSKSFPVSDAGLGSISYLLEALSGFLGATNRWRTAPWMVVLFAIMIVPLGIVSIALIVMQPVVVGAWCTPCLATALFMLVMIPMAVDEVWATGQFLMRAKREGRSLWRTFWVGGAIEDAPAEEHATEPQMPDWSKVLSGFVALKVPLTLVASILIGFWLMASPDVFGASGRAADNAHLVGPLIAVVAATALSEITRAARYANIALGLWLVAAPWVLSGGTTESTINSVIAGIAVIALSIPRGAVRDQYDGWQPYIV